MQVPVSPLCDRENDHDVAKSQVHVLPHRTAQPIPHTETYPTPKIVFTQSLHRPVEEAEEASSYFTPAACQSSSYFTLAPTDVTPTSHSATLITVHPLRNHAYFMFNSCTYSTLTSHLHQLLTSTDFTPTDTSTPALSWWQAGFFQYICVPFYKVLADLVDPEMEPFRQLKANQEVWKSRQQKTIADALAASMAAADSN